MKRKVDSSAVKTNRCAVYTRKSSEEGLDQTYNSLHAQRDACEAYILSQTGEGWTCLPTAYDDGGFSGGSMDRPALQALLADVKAGRVDTVVVYKVDRLTRSLTDFARIVDIFDKAGASFVSVTQSFNTTSSMGRLTLNVLLSFAQFEREVTGERIRDKIAASKARGLWMGGVLPLGYDSKDHQLVLNEPEAETVRHIFARYLKLGSVHILRDELARTGVRSKLWTTKDGREIGGGPFSRGSLFHLLRNQHYLGLIVHKELTYPAAHPPIVDRQTFDAVQRRLASHRITHRKQSTSCAPFPLTGLIFDAGGEPLCPTHSRGRASRLYRYYVSSCHQRGETPTSFPDAPRRLPADHLEAWLLARLQRYAGRPAADWDLLIDLIKRVEVRDADVHILIEGERLFGHDHPDLAFDDLQGRLIEGERAVIEVARPMIVRIAVAGRLQFRGGRSWATKAQSGLTSRGPDPVLVNALKLAHQTLRQVGLSPLAPAATVLHARAPETAHERQISRLAHLAPDIQEAILAGRQPLGMTLKRLCDPALSLDWSEQRRVLGFRRGA